jgi:hypothetical protein
MGKTSTINDYKWGIFQQAMFDHQRVPSECGLLGIVAMFMVRVTLWTIKIPMK